jgi:hypothetical protein
MSKCTEVGNLKLGIMQPYFIPYIGYWQLMNAVDKYVVYDDVNFIKSGWINRNLILVNGKSKYFNIPMVGASSFKLINEVGVNCDIKLVEKNLRTIEGAYKKAPYYDLIYPLIKDILSYQCDNIAQYIFNSFKIICDYMNIQTELIVSSTLDKDNELKAQDKVLEICELLGADEYYNAIGGRELYSFEDFEKRGIKLKFLKTDLIEYKQYDNEFQSNLSILDVMMFNSREDVAEMLNRYTLMEE